MNIPAKGAKKAPAAKPAPVKDEEEEEDIEVVSLAERMRARMQVRQVHSPDI